MRSLALVALLAACGGSSSSGPDMTATTQFAVTQSNNNNPSSLDALVGQTIDLEIILDPVGSYTSDSADCKSTIVYSENAQVTARGASAPLVTTEIIAKLPAWDVRFEQCPTAASSITVDAAVNELNLAFACGTVPASANVMGSDGYPALSSFTATSCAATILDVDNNRVVGATGFSVTFATGPDRLP